MSVFAQGPSSVLHLMDGPLGREVNSMDAPDGKTFHSTPLSEASTAPNTPIHHCQLPASAEHVFIKAEEIGTVLESESDLDSDEDDLDDLEVMGWRDCRDVGLEGIIEASPDDVQDFFAEVKTLYAEKCGFDTDDNISNEGEIGQRDADGTLWISATATKTSQPLNADADDDMLWMSALGGLVDCDGPDEIYSEPAHQDGSVLWMQALDGNMDLNLDSSDPMPGDDIVETGSRFHRHSQMEAPITVVEEEDVYMDPQERELAMLDVEPTPRFDAADTSWLDYLDTHGFVVIANVAEPSVLCHAQDLLWQFLEGCSDWKRFEPSTWDDEGLQNIGSCKHGIIHGAGIGQSDFMWYLRTLPLVRNIFAQLWGTDELITSFDGACVFRPWHHGFRKTAAGWWHVDQGAEKKGRHAVQGLISMFEASGKTGGLTVIPGSHLHFEEFIRSQTKTNEDFYAIPPSSSMLKEHSRRLVCCQAGDLVLWDSRTIHASAPAPLQPETPIHQLLRAAAYICMTPKRFATEEVLAKRRNAYEHQRTTSHWPHEVDTKLDSSDCEVPARYLSAASATVIALVG